MLRIFFRASLFFVLLIASFDTQLAKADSDMPAKYAAALVMAVAGYENGLASAGKDLHIFVFNAPEVQELLKGEIGRKIGKSKLSKVSGGVKLPSAPPDIIFIGTAVPTEMVASAVNYAKSIKLLSFSNSIDVQKMGVGVGLSVGKNNKAKISLNAKYTTNSELKWDTAIIKRAQVVNY